MIPLQEQPYTPEWNERRKHSIGASEIVTVLGLNRYATPLELWARKTGRLSDVEENDYMFLGNQIEHAVAALYSRRHNAHVTKCNTTYRHSKIEWATATPDYFISPDLEKDLPERILEIKTTSHYNADKWEDGQVPNSAHAQVIWQMGVCGFTQGEVACLAGADPKLFFTKAISFEPALFEQMIDVADKFIALVKSDTPPDAKGADVKLVTKLHESSDEPIQIEVSDLLKEWESLEDGLRLAKDTINMFNDKFDELRARILQQMNGHRIATCGNYQIVNKEVKRMGYFCKESTYDKFLIKKIGAK